MTIVQISPGENGGHANQTCDDFRPLPDGWAIFPDGPQAEHFPFFSITTMSVIDDIPTVTQWEPLPLPEDPDPGEIPDAAADAAAMLVDHEYRLTLLELGLTEEV